MNRCGTLLQTWLEIDRREMEQNEIAFDLAVRDYVLRLKPYKHGGVVNAIQTIARICEQQAQEGDGISRQGREDYEKAAALIDAFSETVDLDYQED